MLFFKILLLNGCIWWLKTVVDSWESETHPKLPNSTSSAAICLSMRLLTQVGSWPHYVSLCGSPLCKFVKCIQNSIQHFLRKYMKGLIYYSIFKNSWFGIIHFHFISFIVCSLQLIAKVMLPAVYAAINEDWLLGSLQNA